MPAASTTLSTASSQQPGTKATNNSSLSNPPKKKTKWLFISAAISKKPMDAASKANDISNNNHHLNNDKTTRHFHDSKLDLSKPSKVICSRFNSSSSKLSCNSCVTDNTDTDNTPSSPTNSLQSLSDDIEMILDDDSQETDEEPFDTTIDTPQSSQYHANKSILSTKTKSRSSSVTWVEDLTDPTFSPISTVPPQPSNISNITTNDIDSSQLNDTNQCGTPSSTQPYTTSKLSGFKILHHKMTKKKDVEKSQDNISTNKFMNSLNRLRNRRSKSFNDLLNKENGRVVDESIKDSSSKKNIIETTTTTSSKRKKLGSMEFRSISLPDSSLKEIPITSELNHDSSVSDDEIRCESPVSDSPNNNITFLSKRCSLNEFNNDIRRSWSHIEVRHLKNIFSRKRAILDGKRRNSYAYTNSLKTNQQIAAESEIRLLNHFHKTRNSNVSVDSAIVIKDPPIVTSPVLQVDEEKEIDVTAKSKQMRKFIAGEIYSTEQSYLGHLNDLKKIFMDPFIDAAQLPNPLVNPDDIETIFAHINDLIVLSTIIVEDLESSMDPWQESESMVGEVFLKYRPYFERLLLYAENHQQSRMAIKRANENVLCRKFMQLKKYTPEFHMDYDDLCHAVDNMKTLALECDKTIQQL
ncbi:20753_t:CDS:2 [Cetraspora pellucida]|uniref:20753_t:CDS:1 n=1 Tax=Cetraspora pellucida TaxID=1433469 RepID=A0A9N9GEZ4_9GLOM|nr:20753_t:CDS:2 [Cetraspora pellucida]